MTKTTIQAHYCGIPVRIEVLTWPDGEFQCPVCRRRYAFEDSYVAHATSTHRRLIQGGNAAA